MNRDQPYGMTKDIWKMDSTKKTDKANQNGNSADFNYMKTIKTVL